MLRGKLGWDKWRKTIAREKPHRMARKFRELESTCTLLPGHPANQSGTHLPLLMDLLVQEQGLLLSKELTDERVGLFFFSNN